MKLRNILLVLVCASLHVFAQTSEGSLKNGVQNIPGFFIDCVNFGTSDSIRNRVDVLVDVPFTFLKFFKDNSVFTAEYTTTADVYDSSGTNLLQEKIWSGKVQVPNFEATVVKNNLDISLRSFMLQPGQYLVKVELEDKDSKTTTSQSMKVQVKNLWKPLAISDIVLIMPNSKPEKQKLIPNVPRMVSAKKGEVTVYFEVYSDVATDASFRMDMLGDNSYKVYHAEAYKKLTSGTNRITYVFDSLKITGGEYTIRVSLLDSAKQVIDQAEKSFKAQIPGLPLFIKNVDKAIEEMKYIASQTDMDSLRAGKTPEERLERFNEFWKRRDPSEATEENEVFDEYFRRVNYANANFTHNIDGWKTDMGMVYILLGAPDNVDRHPFDINAKPYEVWEYYQLNQRLVFLDATGFGDYRLITPLTGDLYRYR